MLIENLLGTKTLGTLYDLSNITIAGEETKVQRAT